MAKPPYDVPAAPGKPEVTEYDENFMVITWTPPASDGGSPVTHYIIEKKEPRSSKWTQVTKEEVKETTFKVTDLIEGKDYEFHVAAVNKAGQGPFSAPSEPKTAKLPFDPPSAPGKPTVSNIDATEMTITWTVPESDGGSPILGYFVEKKEPKSSRWVRINSTPVEPLTFKVKDLVEKSKYHFRVIATNKAGEGPASEPSDVHMAKPPYDIPGAPSRPEVTEYDRTKISIKWSPPESDGGSPITGYVVEKRDTTSNRWIKAVPETVEETTLTIENLTEDKEYEFRVAAVNKAGQGPYSEPSQPQLCKPPYDVPEAPGKPDITEVDAEYMVITWTKPKSDGGSPITHYVVERKEPTSTRWMKAHKEDVKELTLKVEGLMEGKEYMFHVAAVNDAGQGPYSEPSEPKLAKLPYDVPGAPSKPEISDIDATKMTVTWTPPKSDGGAPITGYYVERKESSSSRWTRITKEPVLDTTLRAKDLIEKSKYQFRVFAENKAGVGPASEPSDLTMAKLPYERPEVTKVDATLIGIKWSPPASDGGSPITGYVIEKKDRTSTRWTKAFKDTIEETEYTIKDLIEGKEYEFRVAAVNNAGQGPFSEPSQPTLCKPPYGKR
ncbi:twitchin-like [Amphiura filiformis]|uniref:twitchin-like n=1 Tax=Amphiura filiformis TaxID=82378 RepID=UPI003B216DD4